MQLPPSYQTPRRQPSSSHFSKPKTTSNSGYQALVDASLAQKSRNAPLNPAPKTSNNSGQAVATAGTERSAAAKNEDCISKPSLIHRTGPSSHTHALDPIVEQWTETLATLRTNLLSSFHHTLSAQTAQHIETLSALSASHAAARSTLDQQALDILCAPLSEVELTFLDADGVVKGTATLGERMELFAARVQGLRDDVRGLGIEREAVERRIAELGAVLQECVDGLGDGGVERVAEGVKVEIEGVVDAAVGRWARLENDLRRSWVKRAEQLQRIYRDMDGDDDEEEED